jgi:hypothetical protein
VAAVFTRIVTAALVSVALAAPSGEARLAAVTITFTATPAKTSTSPNATFDFTNSVPATFQCYLDGKESPKPCEPPVIYTGLANGRHSFSVVATATDRTGAKGKAAYGWTVSVPPPQTTITSGPSGNVTETTATFSFAADQPDATFSCTLDGGAAEPCTSGVSYDGIALGPHTFTTAATTRYGTDSTPATATWTIAPDTSITSGPGSRTQSTSATFTFTSTSASATFECSLDRSGFTVCRSPQSYERLDVGTHTFAVRATSESLADPTPAQRTWEILTSVVTSPDTAITTAPPSNTASTAAVVAFDSPQRRATFECSFDSAAFARCTSPARFTALRSGKHRVAVRAVLNGLVDKTPATAIWTVTPTTTPHTRFTRQPQPSTHDTDAGFAFLARPRAAKFECSLDGAPFAACTSPLALHSLARGRHDLRIRARVGDVVEATPAAASWRILAAPFPWLPAGAGGGAAVAVLAGALGWGLRVLRRRRWQRNARDEERPQTCTVPQEYVWRHHCKLKPSLASVEHLVLARAENGGRIDRELEGVIVDRLNRAARVARALGSRRVRRTVARAAVELATELDRWVERPANVEITARLTGGKAECEFTRYECVERAGACTWNERASWQAEVEVRLTESVATLLWSHGASRPGELEPHLLEFVASVAGRRAPAPETPPVPEG